jgi:superfamily II DNA or RNA helicase
MHIKEATVSDKIYFLEDDVDDFNELVDNFRYMYGDEIYSPLGQQGDFITLPNNSLPKLKVTKLKDERIWQDSKPYQITTKLRSDQAEVFNKVFENGIKSGIVQARCGWGKTFVGCHIIAHAGVKTVVVVHTKLLYRQWIDELEKQLVGVKIGRIGDGEFQLGDITVAIYHSLKNHTETLRDCFSLMIVDEIHRCPADVFSGVVNSFAAKIKIGFSATPSRKDGKHVLLGDFFTRTLWIANDSNVKKVPFVELVAVDVAFNVRNPTRDWSKALTTLCGNEKYAELIAKCAIEDVNNGRCVIIFSERIILLDMLLKLIPKSIKMVGQTKDRDTILKGAGTAYNVILTTTLFDEGVSCHRLDTAYFTCPTGNMIRVEQRVGRIERDHEEKQWPKIVDFWLKGMIVYNQQNSRARWYKMTREQPEKKAFEIKHRIFN